MPITTPAIYAELDGDPDHFAHVLDHLFRPALESLDYKVLLPSVAGSELIHAEIVKNLEEADLVLCDLSSLNPNVFFELGIRTALDRPTVLVRDKPTSPIPFDLNAINVLTYDGSLKSWIIKDEIPRLTAHIKASVKSASDNGNAMWRYFGITRSASPAERANNPLEAKMDFLITEFTKMRRVNDQLPPFAPALLDIPVGPGNEPSTVKSRKSYTSPVERARREINTFAETNNLIIAVHYEAPDGLIIDSPEPLADDKRSAFISMGRLHGISVTFKEASPH
jgi:hypothetical protein